MFRLRRALSAAKMAEMSKLGACLSRIDEARANAAGLRDRARNASLAATAAEMAAVSAWQTRLEESARQMDAAADLAEHEAAELRSKLARTLGREAASETLIARADEVLARAAERRAEDAPAQKNAQPAA